MKHIVIVEDESDIRDILSFNIVKAGYRVTGVESAEEAMPFINDKVDLILLDVMLPGMSGYDFARYIRQQGSLCPIIFLTALSSEMNMLNGFEVGADDYIGKPFSINEVLARIKAVLKRTSTDSQCINIDSLVIDIKAGTVMLDGKVLELSRKEFDILSLLASNRGRYHTRAEIIEKLWTDSPYVLDRTVDVHIARIRSKLGAHRDLIKNRVGFGYYIDSQI